MLIMICKFIVELDAREYAAEGRKHVWFAFFFWSKSRIIVFKSIQGVNHARKQNQSQKAVASNSWCR